MTGSISKHDSLKIVDKFGAAPMYIMTTKGNTEVMSAVNNALEQLKAEVPDLTENLTEQYVMDKNRNSRPLLTWKRQNISKRQCTHKDRMHW